MKLANLRSRQIHLRDNQTRHVKALLVTNRVPPTLRVHRRTRRVRFLACYTEVAEQTIEASCLNHELFTSCKPRESKNFSLNASCAVLTNHAELH